MQNALVQRDQLQKVGWVQTRHQLDVRFWSFQVPASNRARENLISAGSSEWPPLVRRDLGLDLFVKADVWTLAVGNVLIEGVES